MIVKQYRVVVKRIVSPDGKIIAEAKSVAKASGYDESEIRQSVSVNISSSSSCRGYVQSSSCSSSKSGSSSSSISIYQQSKTSSSETD